MSRAKAAFLIGCGLGLAGCAAPHTAAPFAAQGSVSQPPPPPAGDPASGGLVAPGAPIPETLPDAGPSTDTGERFGPYYGPDNGHRFWGYN